MEHRSGNRPIKQRKQQMKTIKEYILKNYEEDDIENIAQHGIANGFSSLIYYTETCVFYDQYKDEIWEFLSKDADSFGCKSIFEFITNNLRGVNHIGDEDQFKNLLCWYAVERECANILNERESINEQS